MKTLFSFPILLIFVLFFILIIIHFQRLRLAKMFIVSTMLFVYLMCTPLMTQTIFAGHENTLSDACFLHIRLCSIIHNLITASCISSQREYLSVFRASRPIRCRITPL